MLSYIEKVLGGKIPDLWVNSEQRRAEMISLYRAYDAGEHRDGLTQRQKRQLGVDNRTVLDQFNINYMPLIVGKMADRLKVESIEIESAGDDTAAQDYIEACLEFSDFDQLQTEAASAAVRDGYSFIMLEYDSEQNLTRYALETAYDTATETGVIPILNEYGVMRAAVKIWNENDTAGIRGKRVNVYYPGSIEQYISDESGELSVYATEDYPEGFIEWVDETGEPLGIPLHMLSNNKKKRFPFGMSELHNAIPLQDAANWTLIDLVMTSRLTAFPLRKARGFEPDENTAPGDWVIFGESVDQADILSAMDAGVIEQGEMIPFLETMAHIEDRLSIISRTPIPSLMGSSQQSGEALKERESMLIEKVERAQVAFGNAWESVAEQSVKLRNVYGPGLSGEVTGYNTRWKPAQLRVSSEVLEAARVMHEWGYEREALRLIGQLPFLNYSPSKIEQLLEEKLESASAQLSLLSLPGFGSQASSVA